MPQFTNKTVRARISQLAMTSAEWREQNPILLPGEIGYETDTKKVKVGPTGNVDGAGTRWNDITDYIRVPVIASWTDSTLENTIKSEVVPLSASLGKDLHTRVTKGDIPWLVLVDRPINNFPSNFNYTTGAWKDYTYDENNEGQKRPDNEYYSDSQWEFAGFRDVAPIEAPQFKTHNAVYPTVPTPPDDLSGEGTHNIANTEFVIKAVKDFLEASSAMIFKGTVGTGGTITELPLTDYSIGDTYVVTGSNAKYAGQDCEPGDMIICVKNYDSSSADASKDWSVVQVNINGAVTGPTSAIKGNVAVFDNENGKVIADGGVGVNVENVKASDINEKAYSIGSDVEYQEIKVDDKVVGTHGLMTAEKAYKLDHLEGSDITVRSTTGVGDILQVSSTQKITNSGVNISKVLTEDDYVYINCVLPDDETE